MRKLLFTGATLLVFSAGAALAQPASPPGLGGPGGGPGGPGGIPPGPPGFGPGRPPPWAMGRGPGGGPPMHALMHMLEEASGAAQFHFRNGDQRVDIKCATDEPMRACVDAASTLIDKLATARQNRTP